MGQLWIPTAAIEQNHSLNFNLQKAAKKCDDEICELCGVSWHISGAVSNEHAHKITIKYALGNRTREEKNWFNCTGACKSKFDISTQKTNYMTSTSIAFVWTEQEAKQWNFHEKWNLIIEYNKYVCHWWNPFARKTSYKRSNWKKLVFRVYLAFNGSDNSKHRFVVFFFLWMKP